jgi:hypothetical protein
VVPSTRTDDVIKAIPTAILPRFNAGSAEGCHRVICNARGADENSLGGDIESLLFDEEPVDVRTLIGGRAKSADGHEQFRCSNVAKRLQLPVITFELAVLRTVAHSFSTVGEERVGNFMGK